jgi:hypothetical protein
MDTLTSSYDRPRFNDSEAAFFSDLSEDAHTFDFMLILFGLSDTLAVLSPDDLKQALPKMPITILSPSWGDAVNGAKDLVAGKAAESVQLFIFGKYPGLFGKRPQAHNLPFFKNLVEQYTDMMTP